TAVGRGHADRHACSRGQLGDAVLRLAHRQADRSCVYAGASDCADGTRARRTAHPGNRYEHRFAARDHARSAFRCRLLQHALSRDDAFMKAIAAAEAARLLRDGWTIAVSGFGGFGHPEAITDAVEKRFVADDRPRDLSLLFAASNGDRKTRGMNHFAHEGMVRRVIAGGWRGTPRLSELAIKGRIEAYNWPQGVLCQLFRSI